MSSKKIVGPDGTTYSIPEENVAKALSQGFKAAPEESEQDKADRQYYGEGVLPQATALLQGIARTATFGLSDYVGSKVDDNYAETATKLKKYNPTLSTIGDIGGLFLDPVAGVSKLLGRGGAEVAAGAISRTGFIEKLAKEVAPNVVERAGAEVGLAREAVAGARELAAGEKVAGMGERAASRSEQEIYSSLEKDIGRELSIEQKSDLAEHAAQLAKEEAAQAERAVQAGEAGQAATVAEAGIPTAIKAEEAASAAERIVNSGSAYGRVAKQAAANAAQALAFTAGQELSEESLGDHDLNAEKFLATAGMNVLFGGTLGTVFGTAEELLSKAAQKVTKNPSLFAKLDEFANKKAFESFKPAMADITKAMKREGGVEAIGKEIRENGFNKAFVDYSEKLENIKAVSDEVGKKISGVVRKADATGAIVLDGNKIANELSTDLVKISKDPFIRRDIENVLKDIDDFRTMGMDKPLQLSDLHRIRQGMDGTINFLKKNASPGLQAAREARFKLETIIKNGVEQALGKDAVAEYGKLKDKYGRLTVIEKMATKQSQKEIAKSALSSFDLTSLAGHTAAAAALHNPAILVSGLITTAGLHHLKENSSALLSSAAGRLSRLQFLAKQAEKFDAKTDSLISAFFRAPSPEKITGKIISKVNKVEKDTDLTDEKFQAHVTNMANNPQYFAQKMSNSMPGMANAAPNTSLKVNMKAMAGFKRIASAFGTQKNPASIFSKRQKEVIPDFQMHIMKKQAKVVRNPFAVLENLNNGTLSKEEVQTLQEVYPSIYGEIRNKIIERATEHPDQLPFEKKVQLSILFDAPLEESLDPSFMRFVQSNHNYQSNQNEQKQQAQQPNLSNLNFDPNKGRTEIDRITYG